MCRIPWNSRHDGATVRVTAHTRQMMRSVGVGKSKDQATQWIPPKIIPMLEDTAIRAPRDHSLLEILAA